MQSPGEKNTMWQQEAQLHDSILQDEEEVRNEERQL
jgi:hypothetical protein